METHVGEIINEIIKSEGLVQTELAAKADISLSQLNLFLNGKSHLSLKNLLSLLEVLNINFNDFLSSKIKKTRSVKVDKVENLDQSVLFLFNNLDIYSRQTQLKQLQWANAVTKKSVPKEVSEIVEKNLTLI